MEPNPVLTPTDDQELQLLELWGRWWHSQRRAESTMAQYRREVDRLRVFADRPLVELDALTIEAYVYERCIVSSTTGRYAWRAVRSLYGWAASRNVIAENPTSMIRGPKEDSNPTPVTATPEDITRLLASIRRTDPVGLRDRAIIATLWASGLRRSELCRMRLEHIDLTRQTILIPITKTGSPRLTALTHQATDHLAAWLEARYAWHPDTSHVWLSQPKPGTTRPMTANAVKLLFDRRATAAGVPGLTPHALRRGWTVHALRNGVSQVSVQQLGGWSSSAMVERYTRGLAADLALDEFRRTMGGR